MTKTKRTNKLADLGHSLRLLGEALAEAATLRTALFLERVGILAPPPTPPGRPKARRRS